MCLTKSLLDAVIPMPLDLNRDLCLIDKSTFESKNCACLEDKCNKNSLCDIQETEEGNNVCYPQGISPKFEAGHQSVNFAHFGKVAQALFR
uniref:Uncharacterized protein n=1 Tax=Acrobeloides nanus TaxID=290746 RepID=A0A914DWE5_9BILA